jgi:hypothetical protein
MKSWKSSLSQWDRVSSDVHTVGLVRQNVSVRQYFSTQLQNSVTAFFDEIYDRGDGAVEIMARFHQLSDEKLEEFTLAMGPCFLRCPHRSLKGITRLLAVHAVELEHLIDDEGLEVILTSLDSWPDSINLAMKSWKSSLSQWDRVSSDVHTVGSNSIARCSRR